TYSIGEVTPAGYIRTGSAFQSATVSGGGAVAGKNLGNFPIVYTGSNGGDQYTVRIDPANSTRLQIIETLLALPPSPTTYSITKSLLSTITINSGAGDDLITVDYSNGNPIPSVGLNIDAGGHSTSTTPDRLTV